MAAGWQRVAMKKILFAFLLLAACSREGADPGGGNASAPAGQPDSGGRSSPSGPITTLTGLYEGGGEAGPKHQMCMVDPQGETAQFGLVVWGDGQKSCSGSGTASRSGDRLQLKMTGDETCTLDARISGSEILLPQDVPDGCAYYCAPQARMNGVKFTQVGTGRDDAAKAKDLVGDPLC
jgi:hypothetical protein